MDDNTFIRYDSLGTLDSHVTSVASLDDVLFIGNSYGDIRLIKVQESQVLHNHHGEITTLVCRRSCRTGRNDSLYLLSGTSIGNVYLHLVFLDKVTGSRILYKFVTGYSVFSICPHPEFEIFNFKRITNRLTVDFTNDVSKDSDNWKELPSLSISVDSFILSLSNGGIYLVHNCNSFNSSKFYDNDYRSKDNNSPNDRERTRLSNVYQVIDDREKYVIMILSLYSPYSNMKINWDKKYISWIDKEGFYVYLLPNFVSILYISTKHFGSPFYNRQHSLGFKEKIQKTKKIHYLYNIIDNGELYVSTDESDISLIPSGNTSRKSSITNTPRLVNQQIKDILERTEYINGNREHTNNKDSKDNKDYNNSKRDIENRSSSERRINNKTSSNTDRSNLNINKDRIVHMKRPKNRFVNHKYFRNNNSYGTMSRFLSDSVLVGCNNTLLCVKLLEENDEEFGKYHNLLLSTFPNKEVIGYRDMRNNISCRRTSNLVRGYIDFKLVFPEHFNILHVLYSGESQFNLIVFDEGPRNLADKDSWQFYQFEKYNRNGSVTKHKLNFPDQFETGNSPREGRNKITNMIFNLNCNEIGESMCLISLVHCESLSVKLLKEKLVSENIIIGSSSCPGTSSKDDVYICVNNSIIGINYCNNYFNLLKYYISNCYNQNIVVNHFKTNLVSMLNSNIGCMSLGAGDKGRKYVLDYIGIFVDYILEIKYYEGFKIIIEILNRYGKLNDFFGSVFTKGVRVRLEVLGYHDRLVYDLLEMIDEGNSLIYLQIIEWKLDQKVYKSLINKIKTILVNQIYHLYNMFQDSEINMGIDSKHPNNRMYFTNESYFDVLILLNNLNSKNEVEIGDVYSMLYQFLHQTTSSIGQETILSYSLSDTLMIRPKIRNSNNDNKDYNNNNNIYNNSNKEKVKENNNKYNKEKENNQKNDVKIDKNKNNEYGRNIKNIEKKDKSTKVEYNTKNKLESYSLEDDEMSSRLLCLKYYHKCLTEKLVFINTRGVVFPSNKGSGRVNGHESWYIQRDVVNCNICNSHKEVYDKILSKLINKVGGELLDQDGLQSTNVLYFPCRHLVHEKCQVRLINQVKQNSPVYTPVNLIDKLNFYNSNQLLDTCLTCLTK